MSEARRDSTSSLQRKKPPWLKLDIPAVAPPVAEEPSFLQVGPGPLGLWVLPIQPPHHDPIAQPLRRQAFLRSVSMPAETAHIPSPYHEPRRPVLQRQTSITQTIRRYDTPPWLLRGSRAGGWWDRGRHMGSPSGSEAGNGVRAPPVLAFSSVLFPLSPLPPPAWGLARLTYHPSLLPPALALSFSVSPTPMLWLLNSRQVRFGRVHTLPLLGSPAARRALPQRRSLSRSLLRYLGQGVSALASAGVCMAWGLLGAGSSVCSPWGSYWQVLSVLLLACPRAVGNLPGLAVPIARVLWRPRSSCCPGLGCPRTS